MEVLLARAALRAHGWVAAALSALYLPKSGGHARQQDPQKSTDGVTPCQPSLEPEGPRPDSWSWCRQQRGATAHGGTLTAAPQPSSWRSVKAGGGG